MMNEAARRSDAGETHLVTGEVTKSTDVDKEILDLVIRSMTTILLLSKERGESLVTVLRTIYRQPTVLEVLLKMIELRASTAFVLRKELTFSKNAVYQALDYLVSTGLVVKVRPLKQGSFRPAAIYGLRGYAVEDVVNAIGKDRLCRTPAYAEVNRIVQLLLDDYFSVICRGDTLTGRIYRREVNLIVKRECRGVMWADILPLVHRGLRETGLAVML